MTKSKLKIKRGAKSFALPSLLAALALAGGLVISVATNVWQYNHREMLLQLSLSPPPRGEPQADKLPLRSWGAKNQFCDTLRQRLCSQIT